MNISKKLDVVIALYVVSSWAFISRI